ncbi:MAG: SagB/ThcOx family dehydrogenase [Bacteroidales bacterium]
MDKIQLPTSSSEATVNLDQALKQRISCRSYKDKPIKLKDVGDILWAANGISDKRFSQRRTAPSAGATYPLQLYIATKKGSVYSLEPGIYRYNPDEHLLEKHSKENIIEHLPQATYNQSFLTKASMCILIASKKERTTRLYGERGIQYIWMEAGGVCQNIHLKVVEMNLGTVIIGAFEDTKVKRAFRLSGEVPLGIMPIGYPA